MKLKRRLQFLTAVSIAAFSIRRFTVLEIVASFRQLFRALTMRQDQQVSKSLYFRRLRACSRCPVLEIRWWACGNPFRKPEDHPEIGCLCHMATKARMKDATCWIRDHTDLQDEGWKDELYQSTRAQAADNDPIKPH